MNAALGAPGRVASSTRPWPIPDELDAVTDLKALTDAMAAGQVEALVILGGNPVYDAPADLAFADKLSKVPLSVHASLFVDETSAKCTWHVPRAHAYESWGDERALDASVSVRQPLIAPLYDGRDDIELLALMANAPEKTAHDAVRTTIRGGDPRVSTACPAAVPWSTARSTATTSRATRPRSAGRISSASGTARWPWASRPVRRRPGSPRPIRVGDIAAAIDKSALPAPVGPGALEVTFAPCPKMVDGAHANNTWLQEMPDPVTKLVWDNAAIVSPATAKALGVDSKDVIKIAVGDRSITAGVWVLPGQADNSIALTLGWGRKSAGRIGNGRGFDVYPIRTTQGLGFASAQVSKTGADAYFFAQTQEHSSTEGRPIAHEATLADYKQRPNFAELDSPPLARAAALEPAGLQPGPPVGHVGRPQRLHRLRRLRHRLHVREQRARRGQARGLARSRDALAPHRPVLGRGPEARRHRRGPARHQPAARLRALRRSARARTSARSTPPRTAPRGSTRWPTTGASARATARTTARTRSATSTT